MLYLCTFWPRKMSWHNSLNGYFYFKSSIYNCNKKGSDNLVANHLSRLPNAPSSKISVNDYFSNEQLLAILTEPWFTDILNFLVTKETPFNWSKHDKYWFLSQTKWNHLRGCPCKRIWGRILLTQIQPSNIWIQDPLYWSWSKLFQVFMNQNQVFWIVPSSREKKDGLNSELVSLTV